MRERGLVALELADAGRRVWLPDEPDRELVLRDRDEEDVRVAMLRGYAITPSVSCVTRRAEAGIALPTLEPWAGSPSDA